MMVTIKLHLYTFFLLPEVMFENMALGNMILSVLKVHLAILPCDELPRLYE